MEFEFIISLALGLISLVISYFAHPYVIRSLENKKNSAISKIVSKLFSRNEIIRQPFSMSLYDMVYDKNRSAEFDTIIKRRYPDADFMMSVLRKEKNFIFNFSENFLNDALYEKIDITSVVASIVIEFIWHRNLYFPVNYDVEFEVATADGFFVKMAKKHMNELGSIFEMLSISRISNEVSRSRAWSYARDSYFVARNLPHRFVFKENPSLFFNEDYLNILKEISKQLCNDVTKYVLSAVDLSKDWRSNGSVLINRMKESEKCILSGIENDILLKNENYIVKFEYILSLSHKIIFGKSAMSERSVVHGNAWFSLRDIWAASPKDMVSKSSPPPSIKFMQPIQKNN